MSTPRAASQDGPLPEGRYPESGRSVGRADLALGAVLCLFLMHAGYSWLVAQWLGSPPGEVFFAVFTSAVTVTVTAGLSWERPLRLARGLATGLVATAAATVLVAVGMMLISDQGFRDSIANLHQDLLWFGALTFYFPITFLLMWAGSSLIMKLGRPKDS